MGGYIKENSVTSLANPDDWDPVALDFLAETTSAQFARDLMEVSLHQ
jgi:hypothetical protein